MGTATEGIKRMKAKRGLILFARSPRPGQVKTRLEPALGQERTLVLYKRLLSRQIALLKQCPDARKVFWLEGNPTQEVLQNFDGEIFLQMGGDIGERMGHALDKTLEHCDSVILIGCDSPGLNQEMLEKGFQALEEGHDAVFVPATDGGYVLVGLCKAEPELFAGIPWGTQAVMAQTRDRLERLKLSWKELDAVGDIDEPQDLAVLLEFDDAFVDILEGVDVASLATS